MIFLFGVVGFLGFEGLRIYKRLYAKRAISPVREVWLYSASLVVVAIFSGSLASACAMGNRALALYLGFSVPTNIKALFENSKAKSVDPVDDISLGSKPGMLSRFVRSIGRYFTS